MCCESLQQRSAALGSVPVACVGSLIGHPVSPQARATHAERRRRVDREFEAAGEDEVRIRLYRGSGMHPEAKFHTAVRWLREQARARKFCEEEIAATFGGLYALPSCR